ncbi:STAS domain-containing protein [Chryseobacterium potabilaquae]|uniref:Anti-sigma factor antagonist n=1 Tax=Chryseobacterium potabilaquae TaxID=2675057 RepID=A0A6N4X7S0_9FLAO|nr:STAS domain-containing protein [Chryseobacterium potabilaquae]CAA7194409.1 Putative anti-sigma factor antagonist BtrV [Chryseobacterium potabilaquae]
MKNAIKNIGMETIITMNKRMDLLDAQEIKMQLKTMLQIDKPCICIDCTELQYISSNLFRSFISLIKYISRLDGQLFLISMQPEVENILELTGFSSLFNKKYCI